MQIEEMLVSEAKAADSEVCLASHCPETCSISMPNAFTECCRRSVQVKAKEKERRRHIYNERRLKVARMGGGKEVALSRGVFAALRNHAIEERFLRTLSQEQAKGATVVFVHFYWKAKI